VLDPGASKPRSLLATGSESVMELVASRDNPDRMYALGDQHLFVLSRVAGRWQFAFGLPLDGASAANLVESGPDQLWFGDSRGGPQRWTLDVAGRRLQNREVFGARDGLELDPLAGSSIFLIDGQVHVVSGEHGFRFQSPRFVPDAGPPFTLVDRPNELAVETTPLGTYAFTRRQLWFRPLKQAQWQALHLGSQLAAGYSRLRYNHDGVIRLATWSGLLQFNPAEKQPVPAPLSLGFELVTAESPDGQTVLHLPVANHGKPVEIPSGYRLHFRYAMVSMDSGLEFRYLLHGSDSMPEEWSSWTDRDLFIRALTPGDYLLQVEARTRSGRSAAPASYRYKILPSWLQKRWVWALGVLLAVAAVLLLVQ
jgi:hypothetical protein